MKKFLLSTLLLISVLCINAQVNDSNNRQRIINVSGMAEMEIVPDEIYVQITLREYTRKGNSKTDIDDIRKDFIKAALSIGIPDSNISVQSYQGWDGNYWWYKKNKKKNPDMNAGITYQVMVGSTRKMDELVAKLDDEATERFNIARVSHSRLDVFKKQLKIEAVKAAKEKAIYLANAVGENVGEAIVINDPSELGNYPRPMYANTMMKNAMEENQVEEANINFKKMKLQFEVSVTFALK